MRFAADVAPGGVDQLNSARMPTMARLDLRLTYGPRGANGRWQFYFEGLNVLNHKNAFFVDANLVDDGSGVIIREEPVGGLPRIVTFGVRFRFP
jgi:hypothetical protein